MIKSKPCTQPQCTYPRFAKGLCKYHQHLRTDKKTKPPKKTMIVNKRKNNTALKAFFDYHIGRIKQNPACMNCGGALQGIKAEVAHVLPKRVNGGHPELATHLDNAVYLCFWGNNCHARFDDLAKKKEMPIFARAKKIAEKLKPLTTKVTRELLIYED